MTTFEATPVGATITFLGGGKVQQGVVHSGTDRSLLVHRDDGHRSRLLRSNWQARQVMLGDRTRRDTAHEAGYGATPDQESMRWVQELIGDLAGADFSLASTPCAWKGRAGVDGLFVQWLPSSLHADHPGYLQVKHVVDGKEVTDMTELTRARRLLERLGWRTVRPTAQRGLLILLKFSPRSRV